jgi:hypothetical protein
MADGSYRSYLPPSYDCGNTLTVLRYAGRDLLNILLSEQRLTNPHY